MLLATPPPPCISPLNTMPQAQPAVPPSLEGFAFAILLADEGTQVSGCHIQGHRIPRVQRQKVMDKDFRNKCLLLWKLLEPVYPSLLLKCCVTIDSLQLVRTGYPCFTRKEAGFRGLAGTPKVTHFRSSRRQNISSGYSHLPGVPAEFSLARCRQRVQYLDFHEHGISLHDLGYSLVPVS